MGQTGLLHALGSQAKRQVNC